MGCGMKLIKGIHPIHPHACQAPGFEKTNKVGLFARRIHLRLQQHWPYRVGKRRHFWQMDGFNCHSAVPPRFAIWALMQLQHKTPTHLKQKGRPMNGSLGSFSYAAMDTASFFFTKRVDWTEISYSKTIGIISINWLTTSGGVRIPATTEMPRTTYLRFLAIPL